MIDGVILVAFLVPSFIAIFHLMIIGSEGTKGIEKDPYVTKSGVRHTAQKSRSDFIV
jgi:hypothetical protein